MDKKKLAFIGLGVAAALAVVISAIAILGSSDEPQGPTREQVNPSVALTPEEKTAIQGSTEDFILNLGNYGWYPELIKNPRVSSGTESFEIVFQRMLEQEHTNSEDAVAALRELTNSASYDATVNRQAYTSPFSVETRLLESVTVPDYPIAEGDQTFVPVTVPVESTVSYLGSSIGYTDSTGVWHEPNYFVQQFFFEGELNLQFSKDSGRWVVSRFDNTVGVFATDPMTFSNGDLISEYLAKDSNQIPVSG